MSRNLVEKTLVGILLLVAGGIVLHAPLTVWLGVQLPDHAELIKAWKELLMGAALVLLIVATVQRNRFRTLLNDRVIQLALAYAVIHFVTIALFRNDWTSVGAGLLIDLRYVLYFVLVYGTIRLFPHWRQVFVNVFVAGAVVVVGFALLQLFVLPKDALANIGYSKNTIAPYLTVDENHDYIRINSTLRGPNPLGAYVAIVLALLTAYVLRHKLQTQKWVIAGAIAGASGLVLWASYSRSAAGGALVAMAVAAIIAVSAKARLRLATFVAISAVIVSGLLFIFRDNQVISSVVLHDSPTTGAHVDSNDGHWDSLADGTTRLLSQPFGAGVGSTGSASLHGDRALILENHYLFVAHEVGWVGLAIFLWLFVEVLRQLWVRRQSTLALGVFGSGIGLALVGVLLPVWVDDTVSIVWWGLAALSIGYPITEKHKGKKHVTRKNN